MSALNKAGRILLFVTACVFSPYARPEGPAAPVASPPTGARCAFCLTPFRGADEFCARCGRLARLTSTSAEHRFWGDAVYAEFARFGDIPTLQADVTAAGLIHEVVTFASGDRFEMTMGKKGLVIEGKVGGSKVHKEDSYSAEMGETLDKDGRLLQKTVTAKRNGDPDTYLYRVLDYRYTPEGLLDRIVFSSRVYAEASDWKKRPAAWIKNSGGEVVMVRETGTLRAVETKVRTFKRSLRGEPEPGEEKSMRQSVIRSGDLVDRIVPAAAAAAAP